MSKREARQERRALVTREYQTAIVALGLLNQQLARDPSSLGSHRLRRSDFESLRRNLECTFYIRLFAEFEAGLRDVWKHTVRNSAPRTFGLIDVLAARRSVEETVVRKVQAAREYRNSLVHEDSDTAEPVKFADAAQSYRRYFARMPFDW